MIDSMYQIGDTVQIVSGQQKGSLGQIMGFNSNEYILKVTAPADGAEYREDLSISQKCPNFITGFTVDAKFNFQRTVTFERKDNHTFVVARANGKILSVRTPCENVIKYSG